MAAAVSAIGYLAIVGVPNGDVNQAYPAVALTGLAWILVAGIFEQPIRRVASQRLVRPAMLAFNRRAETIYIWHPAAIVVAYAIIDHWAPGSATDLVTHHELVTVVALIVLVALGTAAATLAFGWVEDAGAGRGRLFTPQGPYATPTVDRRCRAGRGHHPGGGRPPDRHADLG